jgi:hypothetical protein
MIFLHTLYQILTTSMIPTANEVESAIKDMFGEMTKAFNLNITVDSDVRPGELVQSQILFTLTGRLSSKLGVNIPNDCYLFSEKKTRKQLSIKEATKKFLTVAKNGK